MTHSPQATSSPSIDQTDCVVRLTGPDAKKVLQGQTTADFESAQPGQHLFATFCNPKGRVLADVLAVVVQDDTLFLRGRRAVMTHLAEHLKPYLAFSKSTLEQTDWLVACERRDADSVHPVGAELTWEGESLISIQLSRGDFFLEHWRLPPLDASAAHVPAAPVSLAEVDLQTSRARIEMETIGAYLPQDLDYDLDGSVSFTKGCYTGQEIIARLHYRGTPKRRLHRAEVSSDAGVLPAGTVLTDEQGKTIGSIVNAVGTPDTQYLLIELIPAAAAGRVMVRNQPTALQSIAACHPSNDQSTD